MSALALDSPPGRSARSILRRRGTSDAAAYSISITTTNAADSALLGRPTGRSVLNSVASKFFALIAILMMVAAGFSGFVVSSQPAQADFATDLVNGICAGKGSVNYGASDRSILAPNTGTGTNKNATPYEKYGMSGTTWTVWVGFDPEVEGHINADDYAGKGKSKGVVNLVGNHGNDANLSQWESQFMEKERNYPGLFNTTNECAAFTARGFPTMMGNFMMNISQVTIWLSGYAYQTSAEVSSGIYKQLEEPVEQVVTSMKDKLYFNYLAPMIMVGALWMAYVGLFKRQATVAFGGLIWSIAAIAVSVVFMTKPMLLPEKTNDVVGGISQSGMAAITSYTHEADGESLCHTEKREGGESDSRTNIRAVQCNLWYSFIYTPWVMGQFGQSPTVLTASEAGNDNGFTKRVSDEGGMYAYRGNGVDLMVLSKNAVKGDNLGDEGLYLRRVMIGDKPAAKAEQNWALYYLDHRSNWDNASASVEQEKIRAQLAVTGNQLTDRDYNSDFRGDNGLNRLAMGLLSLVASLGAGAMVIVISVSLIILDLGVIILTLVSPLFFLAALHPGAGRKIAMGWVEMLAKMALKRIALSIFLAVMVAIFGVMIAATQTMEWAIAMILIVALAMTGLTYQKQISEMFNGFSLGGHQFQKQPLPGEDAGKRLLKQNLWSGIDGGTRGAGKSTLEALMERNSTKKDVASITTPGAVGGAGAKPKGPHEDGASAGSSWRKNDGESPSETSGAGGVPQAFSRSGDQDPDTAGGAGDEAQGSGSEGVDPQTDEWENVGGVGPRPNLPERDAEGAVSEQEAAAVAPTKAEKKQANADAKMVQRREAKRIKQELKDRGYQGRAIGLGTVVAATAKGAIVGGVTRSARAGAHASAATIAAKRARVDSGNKQAIAAVKANEAASAREIERRNKELERQKAREKAEQDRAAKARESQKAKASGAGGSGGPAGGFGWFTSGDGQKPGSAPVVKPQDGAAPKPDAAPVVKPQGGAAPKPVAAPVAKPRDGAAPRPDAAPVVKPQGGAAPKLSTAAKQAAEGMQAQPGSRREAREARDATAVEAIQPKPQGAPPLPPAPKKPSA